jgi:hypothetical protein
MAVPHIWNKSTERAILYRLTFGVGSNLARRAGRPGHFSAFLPGTPAAHASVGVRRFALFDQRTSRGETAKWEKPTKVRPPHARAVVKRIEAEDKTANGIIIARMPETNDTPA